MSTISLGELSRNEFLHDYWQKKPLLIRQAQSNFSGLLTRQELMALASREEVQSRLVFNNNDCWVVKNGPFVSEDFSCNEKFETLLVHDVNHFYPAARDLLRQFCFIPDARLDDLMISCASKGGSIGPHVDSYDVFLLQGYGIKRWQISSQQDKRLIDDIPLKILSKFVPEQEWVLHSGDMLYLPPNYAHCGVAESDDCMTYSIGFRAPSHQELMIQFLVYLQDNISIDGWYQDPDLALQTNPATISSAMFCQIKNIINQINWCDADIEDFLGIYLTEPKSHVFFSRPENPLCKHDFIRQAEKLGLQLDLKSRILVRKNNLFINGERYTIDPYAHHLFVRFAGEYKITLLSELNSEIRKIFYQWYEYGYIALINEVNR